MGLCLPLSQLRPPRRRVAALDVPLQLPAATLGHLTQTPRLPPRLQRGQRPEKLQLAALCFEKRAEVRPLVANNGFDRCGRTVAHVACSGMDASAQQVRGGMAWVFDRYVTDRRMHQLQDE